MTGSIFDIKRYAIHDGPGIRTTVFFKGCPLSCPWCHNPEGKYGGQEILLVPDLCIKCGACLEECPRFSIVKIDGSITTLKMKCTQCGQCVDVCPTEARRKIGRETSVTDLMDRLLRDRPFYEESNGGVTFSGGEPFQQPEFLLACLRACRENKIHTAIDTSGYVGPDLLFDSLPLTDLYLYDLKTTDEQNHRSWTGVSVKPILENLQALDKMDVEVWIRIPLIPGVNDDETSLESLGGFLTSLRRKHPIQILPYHVVGSDKAGHLLKPGSEVMRFEPPSIELISLVKSRLASFGLNIKRDI